MWKWLKAIADYDRLHQDNVSLRQEVSDLRRQLLEEIDSNREREDALLRSISGVTDPGRRRNSLATAPTAVPEQDEEEDDPELPNLVFGEVTDEMVRLRAQDYMAEAVRNGMSYDFKELCAAIKANPQEFLSN
jgi:hypothetical protein